MDICPPAPIFSINNVQIGTGLQSNGQNPFSSYVDVLGTGSLTTRVVCRTGAEWCRNNLTGVRAREKRKEHWYQGTTKYDSRYVYKTAWHSPEFCYTRQVDAHAYKDALVPSVNASVHLTNSRSNSGCCGVCWWRRYPVLL